MKWIEAEKKRQKDKDAMASVGGVLVLSLVGGGLYYGYRFLPETARVPVLATLGCLMMGISLPVVGAFWAGSYIMSGRH
jgi:hypothetical protein